MVPGRHPWFTVTRHRVDELDYSYSWWRLLSHRPAPGVPGAYWLVLRRANAIIVPVVMVNLVAIVGPLYIIINSGRISSRVTLTLLVSSNVAMCVFAAVMHFFPRIMKRRYVKRLCAADFLICIDCGYSLAGLPDDHICPECGNAYELPRMRQDWEKWIARVHQ